MPSFKTLLSLAAVASTMVAAVPLNDITQRDLDHFDTLLKRDGNELDGFPSCEGKENDPSYKPKSQYKDGEGKMLSQRDDKCGKYDDDKCWTDYFLVGTTSKYNDWVMGPNGINCDGNCVSTVSTVSQNCTTITWTVSQEVSVGFSAELEGLGVEMGASMTNSKSTAKQACSSAQFTNTCTWTDKNCHSIWTATQKVTVHGYMRRSCNTPKAKSDIQMKNSPKRADGFYTHGMADFKADLPGPTIFNCDGGCDGKSPGKLPGIDSSMKAIP